MIEIRNKILTNYSKNKNVPKNYVCVQCNKSYTSDGNLSRHLKFECGLEPRYKCPYCGKLSKLTTNVWKHITGIHPDNKLYCIDVSNGAVVKPRKRNK